MNDSPSSQGLRLAVVGHTNTGKTSLMRTLMRDAGFGEVAPSPATTRQVEGAALEVAGETLVELYDTPGMEDAGGLIELIEALPAGRHAGPERIRAFLERPEAAARFEQEARVLQQVLASDAALYVIDAREPVLGKYQDELAILALCARPVLPVLNFTAWPDNRAGAWREALARVNLHAMAEFDTVVFSVAAETTLWRRLAHLLTDAEAGLERLIEDRAAAALAQRRAAARIVAELLIDAAGCQRAAPADDAHAEARAGGELRRAVLEREQRAVDQLLGLFRFSERDLEAVDLPLSGGRWETDLFDPAVLAHYAAGTGKSAGIGAAGGAAVDIATGGMTLGAGTLVGTALGTGVGVFRSFGQSALDKLRGRVRLQVEPAALDRLAWRQVQLVRALEQRGHASQEPIRPESGEGGVWPGGRAPRALLRARLKPDLSSLNGTVSESARRPLIERLAPRLEQMITAPAGAESEATTSAGAQVSP